MIAGAAAALVVGGVLAWGAPAAVPQPSYGPIAAAAARTRELLGVVSAPAAGSSAEAAGSRAEK
jgi:hypothetical protein